MKSERAFPKVSITSKAARSLKNGHPWVYGDEILSCEGDPQDGAIVDCFEGSSWQGAGFYNSKSKITVRIISRNSNDVFDQKFWYRRILYAVKYRMTVMQGEDFKCCRIVHGEADQMPGFTCDRYGDIAVTQIASLGLELNKDAIYRALIDVFEEIGQPLKGIYERNDLTLREKEGLELNKGWYDGKDFSCITEIVENGIKYSVDVENGQKTGFFLDQKYNRLAASKIAKDKNVLDCFTHTGSFGLNCALAGARHVTSVDISDTAIEMARANAARNNLQDKIDYVCEDVFELLTKMAEKKDHSYDYIILDPPAFTKSRQTVDSAGRGYKEINLKAMKLLPRGGYLSTCSCSHFMTDELFRKMLVSAARDASVSLRQIEARTQAPDHPILWNVPETDYLKFYIFQIV
ncbi:23S rRNA (cytosine1962-C5)-methyltransferase [Ruminococcaceae bacterium YAD3003]|nr:23S rRNA (cytosine1962-C5)-methyltransferase [Ruminococcaceae bacterium YAD3003]